MIFINKISELKKHRKLIDQLFINYGQTHFHHYFGIESSLIQNKSNDFYVIIDSKNLIVTSFKKISPNIWECFFKGIPFLSPKNIDPHTIEIFLQKAKFGLSASTLYFPLIFRTSSASFESKDRDLFYIYERLPDQIIKPPFLQKEIWKRVKKRYGSRAERQKTKFEKNLYIKTFTKINIMEKLVNVESNSWKRLYKQDMISRDNQIEFYNHLVRTGLAEITLAYNDKGRPIAFRIDVEINKILYVLKWSYDNDYKKYSPGFYLLTVDLFKRHREAKFEYIDLYGSLDNLKALIKTDELERVDIILSDCPKEAKQISEKKLAYDTKVRNNYKNRNGIQKLFKLG